MAPQQAVMPTAGRRRSKPGKKKAAGDDTALLLFGDAFVTALWVLISSLFAEVSSQRGWKARVKPGHSAWGGSMAVAAVCVAAV
jgi:geranylgeranyl pyrophosphate synthase